MEPPLKRPRLSLFADETPNADLDTARHHNDRFLKSRFEAIFQKYERDFSGIGDEVDLSTGEILVNNGHLDGLDEDADTRSEADESVGEQSPRSVKAAVTPRRSRPIASGRAMLRAMTVAPDRGNAYFENGNAGEVIESIETIAEAAASKEDVDENDVTTPDLAGAGDTGEVDSDENGQGADDDAESETDDEGDIDNDDDQENVDPEHLRETSVEFATRPLDQSIQDPIPAAESDADSLFDADDGRESTPDSLFEHDEVASSVTPMDDGRTRADLLNDLGELDHDAIIARFGEGVGQEILSLVEKRDKAELHIERAWRIPVHIEQAMDSAIQQDKQEAESALLATSPATPRQGTSIWGLGLQGNRRLELHQERTMRVIRAESEDPLQDGFGAGGQVEVRVAEISLDRGKRLLNRGTCPFCKEQFYSTGAAMGHLRNMLAAASEQESGAGVHTTDSVKALLDVVEDGSNEHEPESSCGENDELDARVVYDSVERDIDSEDDLFADAGHVHSDSEEELEQEQQSPAEPGRINMDPVSPLASRAGSLEIPDSDEPELGLSPFVPNISGRTTPDSDGADLMLRFQGSSARRRRGSSSFRRAETDADELPTSTPAATPYPAFKETADPFDRNGDRDYRDRNWKNKRYQQQERSHLSLRPRRSQKRTTVEVLPLSPASSQSRTALDVQETATKPGKRTTRIKKKSQLCESEAVLADNSRAPVPFDQAISAATSAVRAVSESLTRWGQTRQTISNGEETEEQYHTPEEVRCSPEPVDAGDDLPPFPDFDNTSDCEADDGPLDPSDGSHPRDDSERASVHELGDDVDLNDRFGPVRISSTPSEADELDMLFAENHAEETSGSDSDAFEAVYHFNVADFKSLVIMHEVHGHGLEAVGERMSDHYRSYRTRVGPSWRGILPEVVWTEEDEMLLRQLSLNDHTLMETIKRRLPHFRQFDIGNRLAEWWLYEFCHSQQSHPHHHQQQPKTVAPLTKPPHARSLHLLHLDQSPGSLDVALPPTTFAEFYENSKRKHPPEPISQRVCRQQNPQTGAWRGCGRIFSQRDAVLRHWKATERACLKEGFDRMKKPENRRRTRVAGPEAEGFEELEGGRKKGGEVQCRQMSPGRQTVVRGCGKWFSQKSTMYRHWRQRRGRYCRPEWYRWPSEPDADEGRPGTAETGASDVDERPAMASSAAETANLSASIFLDEEAANAAPKSRGGQTAVVFAGLDVSAIVRPSAAAADISGAGST
ncbi:uncharacterized protein AB675_4810 [Cyphellophora attinorum]|uniref:Uncharacterized protein n=1 Tax=Cyphellophora attinorum TaxID=1664694 RepID=A0A0N1H4G4_9EURO|nr:uncharacterized protein AB675_4810 [Phialophora attinorum]KPI35590.1 hypothetical protein AB675_4810 [Phialophora attinorum]